MEKLESTARAAERLQILWETPHTFYGWISTVDHKKIGKRYLVTAFIFLLLGGIEAAFLRWQLARPNQHVLSPEAYNQIFTMHGVTMIFWYASPILSGFGNYLVPLLIGARDMAFPRLNAFSYWVFLLSGVFLYTSFALGAAPHGGWFAYVPYTGPKYSPDINIDFYALALVFLTISTTVGAINFIVTILRLRAPGMSLNRMPLMGWSTLTTSFVSVAGLPPLTAACLFLELDRQYHTHFFDVAHGGMPMLWQQLFWFFGHPWVYIVFLPATGMISMIIPVFSRRPLVGFMYVALATVLTGLVGFGVWVHHMFATGMPQMAMSFFSAASMTISIMSAIQMYAWIATMWHGRPVLKTPMLFAIGFMLLFVIGGLNGIITAVIPVDWQLTDSYFVVAHLHYVLVGANVFPVFAAFYYWLPKMIGRLPSERLGKWNFWLMFIGMNVLFFPMHIVGMMGMARRIYTYQPGLGFDTPNMIESIGAVIFVLGVLVGIYNFFWTRRYGLLAGKNPWRADTLEWETESPPPPYGSVHIPSVATRHPLWDDHDEEDDPDDARVLDHERLAFTTSWLDAEITGVAKMPEDTAAPLWTAIAITIVFYALVFKILWLALIATVVTGLFAAYWLWPEQAKKVPA